MLKNISIVIFSLPFFIKAQDTIYYSHKTNSIIDFGKGAVIKSVKIGTQGVFVSSEKINDNMLSLYLKVKPSVEELANTNLFVLFESGDSYYANLVFNAKQKSYFYKKIIVPREGIVDTLSKDTTVKKIKKGEKENTKTKAKNQSRKIKEEEFCKQRVYNAYNKNSGLLLELINYFIIEDSVFWCLKLTNKSNISYLMEDLVIFESGEHLNATFSEKEAKIPFETVVKLDTVKRKSYKFFVIKTQKITLPKEGEIRMEITESKGKRDLSLVFSSFFVNEPLSYEN